MSVAKDSAAVWIAIVITAGVLLFLLDRLGLWLEARGWLYYRRTKHRPRGALGEAFLEIQSMVDPGKRVVLEEKRRRVRTAGEAAGPPEPGESDGRGDR